MLIAGHHYALDERDPLAQVMPAQLASPDYPKWEFLSHLTWEPASVFMKRAVDVNTTTTTTKAATTATTIKPSNSTMDGALCLGATEPLDGGRVNLVLCASPFASLVLDSNYHVAFLGAAGR